MRTAVAAFLALAPLAAGAEDHVSVYNWSEYVAEEALAAFEAETGVGVIYDTYGEPEVAETRLAARGSGYDVAVVSSEYLGRLVTGGAVQPIGIDAGDALDPAVTARLAPLDPDQRHALPYLWGMTGLAVDPSILASLGAEAPADSWSLLFDPGWVSRFAECGVAILDAPEEALAAALLWLGRDPNSADPDDVAAGLSALAEIAPYVSHFTSEQLDLMRDGEVCLALSWSTDVTEMAGALTFVVPHEGGLMWVDLFVIPVDSENPAGARRFVEFMLRPEISALNTNETLTANAVRAAQALTDPVLLADEAVHPSPEKKERLHVLLGRSAAEKREILRQWIRIKLRGHR